MVVDVVYRESNVVSSCFFDYRYTNGYFKFFPSTLYSTSNILSQRLEEFGTSGHHTEVQIREERLKIIANVYRESFRQACVFGSVSAAFVAFGVGPMLRGAGIDSDSVRLIEGYFRTFSPGLIASHGLAQVTQLAIGLGRPNTAGIMFLSSYVTAGIGHLLSVNDGYWSTAAGVGMASTIAATVNYLLSVMLLRSRSDEFSSGLVVWLIENGLAHVQNISEQWRIYCFAGSFRVSGCIGRGF